jgi:hypothetical protein
MATQVVQRLQKPDVLRLFPSFVWKAELKPEVHQPINDLITHTLGSNASCARNMVVGGGKRATSAAALYSRKQEI